MRSFFAAGFPLFARQMFNNMTIKWAGTLIGGIALILVPVPVAFLMYGQKLREKSKFAPTLPKPVRHVEEEEEDRNAVGEQGDEKKN